MRGSPVILATDGDAVQLACCRERVRLIVLGQSLLPSDKRRIWLAAKAHRNVPILELYHDGRRNW